MKKQGIVLIIALFIFVGCVVFLSKNNKGSRDESVRLPLASGELLVSSKEGYNSVEIYQQENQLVINAESEAAFFDATQLMVETQGEISAENVEIVWTTIGGGTEMEADNDLIIAEIKISENDDLIFDTKINFAKKGFDAVEDVLKHN